MRVWRLLLAAAIVASPFGAQAEFVDETGGWTIERDPTSCTMVTDYVEGTHLVIGRHPGESVILIGVSNSQWQSVQQDALYPVTVNLNGTAFPVQGTGIFIGDKRGLLMALPLAQFDHMPRGTLTIVKGGTTLVSFQFAGSEDRAFYVLARCMQGQNDPFSH